MTEVALDAMAPGTILLGKYRVIRELGTGGMSTVLAAEHVSLGTKVAIKLLLPELAALPDASQRFVREAKAVTRVQSEHVAKVLDVGTLPDGPPYMLMEYLEGKDLGRYVREGKRFSITEAIDYLSQATDAISRAHAAGVIHRDVKPSNLFLTQRPDGSPLVKVLDFGISKVVEEAAKDNLELTKTTAIMGSALYMSLEQMRSTKTVDHRTDIWAMGVSLYELLTGTHPFTAETFSELCVKVSLDPPEPLRKHRPDVPQPLADAIEIAYARNVQERYQTAGSFAAALSPWATAETRARIESIRRFERQSWPDGKIPERQPTPLQLRATTVERPPQLDWTIYAAIAGAGIAGAGVLWLVMEKVPSTTTGGGLPDAAVSIESAGSGPGPGPSTTTTTTMTTTVKPVDSVVTVPSGVPVTIDGGVDAGVDGGKVLLRPCKPGDTIILPNGLRKPCGT